MYIKHSKCNAKHLLHPCRLTSDARKDEIMVEVVVVTGVVVISVVVDGVVVVDVVIVIFSGSSCASDDTSQTCISQQLSFGSCTFIHFSDVCSRLHLKFKRYKHTYIKTCKRHCLSSLLFAVILVEKTTLPRSARYHRMLFTHTRLLTSNIPG